METWKNIKKSRLTIQEKKLVKPGIYKLKKTGKTRNLEKPGIFQQF